MVFLIYLDGQKWKGGMWNGMIKGMITSLDVERGY
jgi:hypothetical protein